jgi:hypothetical protein
MSFIVKIAGRVLYKGISVIGFGCYVYSVIVVFQHHHKTHETDSLGHELTSNYRKQHLNNSADKCQRSKIKNGYSFNIGESTPVDKQSDQGKNQIKPAYYISNIDTDIPVKNQVFIDGIDNIVKGNHKHHEFHEEKRDAHKSSDFLTKPELDIAYQNDVQRKDWCYGKVSQEIGELYEMVQNQLDIVCEDRGIDNLCRDTGHGINGNNKNKGNKEFPPHAEAVLHYQCIENASDTNYNCCEIKGYAANAFKINHIAPSWHE